MKRIFLKSLALVMMLCASLSAGAKQYCEESMKSAIGWDGNYTLTIEKTDDTHSLVAVSVTGEEQITGFYQFVIQKLGGGTAVKAIYNPNDGDFNNENLFSIAADRKSAKIVVEWTKYPTTNVDIHLVLRRNNTKGGSDIFGNTISDADVSLSCSEPRPSITKAPTPTHSASNVKSIYSDAYTPATAYAVGSWGQSTTEEDIEIASGEHALLLTNCNYQGWEIQGQELNIEGMTHIHLDVYVENASSIGCTPIWHTENNATGEEIKTRNLVAGWNSIDIPLSEYQGLNYARIFQIKYANMPATCWIDNVYFVKNIVALTGITIDKTEATLSTNETLQLIVGLVPADAVTDNAIVWTSNNKEVATISETGLVTAVTEGTAVITATVAGFTATCTITVKTPSDKVWYGNGTNNGVDFDYTLTYKTAGEIEATIVRYSTKDGLVSPSISIDDEWKDCVKDGEVWKRTTEKNFADKEGTKIHCFLYQPYANGAARYDFDYIVGSENTRPTIAVTAVQISNDAIDLTKSETYQLSASVLPKNATNKAVSWSSDDEAVASVDENGLVTAKAAGVAHITATTADGGFTASCTITVVAAIEPMTFYGRGSHSGVDIIYSITRNTERHLVYTIHVKTEKEVSVQVNDDYRTATKENENYIYTSEAAYSDGETVKGFFYMVFTGGAARVDFTYTVGAENAPIIYTATDASTLKEHTDVILAEGAILTISTDKALGDVHVENGAILNADAALTADNLYLSSQMGGGKSAQVRGAEKVTVKGDVYFDITFGDDANPEKWHAFTVPFQVDALSGIYDTDNKRLTNEVNYAIMDYHGDVRATGKYGWKKYRGMLQPGTFYIMTVDGNRKTFRLKKAAGATLNNAGGMAVHQYAASGEGENGKDNGWNGIGNPSLVYGTIGVDVQVLNPATYTYELKEANTTNFTVGTPFFYQAAADGTETLLATDAGKPNYAPARESLSDKIYVGLSDGGYEDRVVLSASEDATTGYETGRDLVKLTMTDRPAVPQIFAQGYGLNLCKMDAPLANNTATYPVMLYAPEAGEYTLSARSGAEATVYLTKEGVVIWNLSDTEYHIELNKGNNEGYGILLKANAPQTPTDIDNIYGGVETEKVLFEGNLYILHGGHTYDATGKMIQ